MKKEHVFFALLLLIAKLTYGQFSANETKKWYFGNNAGLDFMTSPPTVLTNGAMSTIEGCATISDAGGNLLFYTDGITVYDNTHLAMANGTGLTGNSSSSQSAIIAKQPGNSNIYYIFSNSGPAGSGAAYSIVDMSLAAGLGSVTTKNTTLSATTTEKLTSVKHCNGIDTWIIIHDWNSADFKAFLLTGAGVNTTPVISTLGSFHSQSADFAGCMKTSVTGKKIGLALHSTGAFELFDFDNTIGVVSNSLSLITGTYGAYGCEFSPDGTKFYGSTGYGPGKLFQWDLCAGSNTAIVNSRTTIFTSTAGIAAMQNAADGKIYIARFGQPVLGIIGDPNALSAACNYTDLGLSIAPKSTIWSIPNFITSSFKSLPPPFTYSVSCATASFSAPSIAQQSAGCQSATYSVTNVKWNFGDPSTASTNTSTLLNPIHVYPAAGTYTTNLIIYYSCGGGTDTLKQAVTIAVAAPSLSVTGVFTVCTGDKRIYSVSGANTYSWNTGAFTPSISLTPTVSGSSVSFTVTGTNTTTGCSSKKTFSVTVNKCTNISMYGELYKPGIYPNPASSQLNIHSAEVFAFEIVDIQKGLILSGSHEAGQITINVSQISSGMYFIKIKTSSGYWCEKWVKTGE